MPLGWVLAGALFRADCYRLRRFRVRQRRCGVSFHGMLQRHFHMVLAPFVVTLGAVLRRGAVALGGVFVFLRSGGGRFNYMAFSVHGNVPDMGLPARSRASSDAAGLWPLLWPKNSTFH